MLQRQYLEGGRARLRVVESSCRVRDVGATGGRQALAVWPSPIVAQVSVSVIDRGSDPHARFIKCGLHLSAFEAGLVVSSFTARSDRRLLRRRARRRPDRRAHGHRGRGRQPPGFVFAASARLAAALRGLLLPREAAGAASTPAGAGWCCSRFRPTGTGSRSNPPDRDPARRPCPAAILPWVAHAPAGAGAWIGRLPGSPASRRRCRCCGRRAPDSRACSRRRRHGQGRR
jgi:hypothetical protein